MSDLSSQRAAANFNFFPILQPSFFAFVRYFAAAKQQQQVDCPSSFSLPSDATEGLQVPLGDQKCSFTLAVKNFGYFPGYYFVQARGKKKERVDNDNRAQKLLCLAALLFFKHNHL